MQLRWSGPGLEDTAMRDARIYVPNVQLREHRLRHNLTLEEVAEALIALAWERFAVRVGVNAGMVGKWERGEKRPSRFYQRLFVLLYGVPGERLGFRPAGPSDQAASLGDARRTLGLARAALRGQDRRSPRARALALRQEEAGHARSRNGT